jgi:hypothetical protein
LGHCEIAIQRAITGLWNGKVNAALASTAKEGCALDRSKQYRQNAADSLMLAHAATTAASQDYWRTMAEFWFRLAQHVEETEAVSVVGPSAVPEISAGQDGEAPSGNPAVST